ncbi:MAG TPA: lipoprotein insertase outer membrane protein LolB [Steroidobacteraceae bacterium]|nr:lipoprotein insertase outer membrane protein LolB [Steroidobacteraceae bacterium]
MQRSTRFLAPRWGALLGALALAGCATVPGGGAGPGTPADPERLTQWVAKGRIALTAQGEGGAGAFVWQQRSERTELSVRGPFGAGGLSVVTDGETLELDDGSGQAIDGERARLALEQRLGTSLPLAELRYWMLGVPAPSAPAQRASGPVPGFTQAGWVVEYPGFRPAGPWSLPARLTATTANARVRLVIDDWQLPPDAP